MICTNNHFNFGACNGDSGDPLVDVTDPANKVLVRITSLDHTVNTDLESIFVEINESYSFL